MRSTTCPNSRLTHLDSGNCGSESELKSNALAALKSWEIFLSIDCMVESDNESVIGLNTCLMMQGGLLRLILAFVGALLSELDDLMSKGWVQHCLDVLSMASLLLSVLDPFPLSLTLTSVGLSLDKWICLYLLRTLMYVASAVVNTFLFSCVILS